MAIKANKCLKKSFEREKNVNKEREKNNNYIRELCYSFHPPLRENGCVLVCYDYRLIPAPAPPSKNLASNFNSLQCMFLVAK